MAEPWEDFGPASDAPAWENFGPSGGEPLVTGRDLQTGGETPFQVEQPDTSAAQLMGVTNRAVLPYATVAGAGALAGSPAGGVGAAPGALLALGALGLVDLGASLYNVGAAAAGNKPMKTGSEAIRDLYGMVGVGREPQTKAQAVYSEMLGGGLSALGGAGAARQVAQTASKPLLRSVANKLAEGPGIQTAAGAAAAGAPEAAYQYGDVTDPYALMGLSLLGGEAGARAGTGGARVAQAAETAANRLARREFIAPSEEALKARAKASFKASEDTGQTISPVRFGVLQSRLENAARDAGYRADNPVMGEITSVLNDVAERTGKSSQDITDIHNVRRLLGDARDSKEKAVRRVAGILTDQLDEYVGGLQGGPKLLEGIADYAKMSKSEEITYLLERAGTYTSKEPADAIRQQFATLARNPNRLRRFNPAERTAIRDIATGKGGFTKTLETLSKLAPGLSKERAVATLLGAGGATGAAYFGVDPVTAAAMYAASAGTGATARAARNAMAQRQANALAAAMRRGDVRMPVEFGVAPRALAILPQAAETVGQPR